MFNAVNRQIKRFLTWLNSGGPSVKDAENHRRDIESRYGGGGDHYGP
jgi:hypothetical protein